MTKAEFIKKRGLDAYNKHVERVRKYHKKHKEQDNQKSKEWKLQNKDKNSAINKVWYQNNLEYHLKKYCENIEYVYNYELAKADNFVGWELHHILENYWSSTDLKKKGLYYKVNPESLIFMPSKIHNTDACISGNYPERSKWHKRYYSRLKK